ncbi:hypothetical protein N9Y92_03900, partial [Chlamydiales bacterium]|nr:hypothetical protein [Chlamydiales bacterium]
MRTSITFLLLLIYPFISYCEIAIFESDIQTIIDGRVSVLSGEHIDINLDLFIPSIEPLSVQRSSIPNLYIEGTCLGGWAINLQNNLEVNTLHHASYIREGAGTAFTFLAYPNGQSLNLTNINHGMTNLGRGSISGKTNVKNHSYSLGKDYLNASLKLGSGEKKNYVYNKTSYIELISKKKNPTGLNAPLHILRLESENKPNGCLYHYSNFNKYSEKVEAFSGDGQSMGHLIIREQSSYEHFKASNHGRKSSITTSDGRSVTYTFGRMNKWGDNARKKNHWYTLLTSVNRSNGDDIHYEYEDVNKVHKERISKRSEGDQFYHIQYYDFDKACPWKANRVKAILEPAGPDNQVIPTRSFFYFLNPDHEENYGRTDVYDAHNRHCIYYHNKAFRPTSINHSDGGKEQFFWAKPESKDNSCLMARLIHHPVTKEFQAKSYVYDNQGNPLKKTLWGNLSGHSPNSPSFGSCGEISPNSAENYTITHTYFDSSFNNTQSDIYPNGLEVHYTYLPGTDLVTSKLVKDKGKICERTFFRYNSSALVETITDDGSTPDQNNLTDVQVRLITRNTIIREPLCFGFPKVVEELYLDQKIGQEVSLKKTEYSYNALGQITEERVFDSQGVLTYILTKHYDNNGNCFYENTPSGEEIRRDFKANNLLIKETGPHPHYHKEFSYNKMGHCTEEREIFPEGLTLITRHQYDNLGDKVATTDPLGCTTNFEYDHRHQIIKKTIHLEKESVETHYLNDIFGNQVLEIDPLGNQTTITYNSYNQPVITIYPDQTTEVNTYNLDGTLKESKAKNGVLTAYSYDTQNRLIEKNTFGNDGSHLSKETSIYRGNLLVENIDPEGFSTEYQYDGAGREIAVIKGDAKTTYTYDASGNITQKVHWDGDNIISVEVEIFDESNRVIEEWIEDGYGNKSHTKQFTYDPFGNQSTITVNNKITTYEYDPHKRLIKTIDAEGGTTSIHYTYYSKNLLKTLIDPMGNQILTTYDPLGQEISIEKKDAFGTTLSKTLITYDLLGNPLQKTHSLIGRQGKDQEILFEYDSLSRIKKLIEAPEKITYYDYNELGQKTRITKPDGKTLDYTYDSKGRLQTLKSSDQTISYTYHYDHKDQLLKILDSIHNKATLRSYTPRGQITSETLATGYHIAYSYDPLDRLIKVTLPDHSSILYTHTPFAIKTVTRLNTLNESIAQHHYFFDLDGNIIKESLPDGSIRTSTYDLLNRITSITHPAYSSEDFKYDPVGNLHAYTSHDALGTQNQTYSYDSLYQLIKENDHTYTYDSLFNRTAKDNSPYQINLLNQLTHDEETSYSYDLNGNLTSKGTSTYTYDALDRLITVTNDQTTHTYTYDHFHRRLSDGTRNFLYFIDNEVGALVNNQLTEFRTLGIGLGAEIGAAILLELNNISYIPHHDHNGNLTATTSPSIQTYRYTAYGEKTTASILSPWGYASKRLDPNTNFIYFGRRFYNPQTGRWITTDPAGYQAGSNLYAYVLNSPLTHFDLYGLIDEKRTNNSFFNNPRTQGALQAFGGFMEASSGASLTLSTGGFGALAGVPIMAHGYDHFFTGMNTLLTGTANNTVTSQLFQKTGLSQNTANSIDDSLSMIMTIGAKAGAKA